MPSAVTVCLIPWNEYYALLVPQLGFTAALGRGTARPVHQQCRLRPGLRIFQLIASPVQQAARCGCCWR